MKKFLVLFLTFVVGVTFAACGDSVDSAVLGNVKGSVYENEFIGIGCKLDSQWTFFNDEQLREMNNIAEENMDMDIEELFENTTIVYDMYAERYSGIDNINVNLEKVDPEQLEALVIKDNFNALAPMIVSNFESMGFSNVTYEVATRKIDGQEFDCLNVSYETEGMRLFQSNISIKCDGYLANITFTTSGGDVIDELTEMFYLIK
ncbi:MAG: hypothetical protein IKU82_03025 [Clostridia bacterium]|nr:hypothetical protein [Clostridia bacterium]